MENNLPALRAERGWSQQRLADELGDDQWRLQRDIAAVFDPLGILNPGKVFSPDA